MAPRQIVNYQSGPYASPFGIQADLASGILAANLPYEGIWTPLIWAKNATIETSLDTGTFATLQSDIWGTNQQSPLNTYVATIGNSETDGDSVGLKFTNPLLPDGSKTVSIITSGGESLANIATALAAAIAADTDLAPLGFTASAVGAAITIQWPSTPGGTVPPLNSSQIPFGSTTILAAALSAGATETITITLGADGTNLTPSHIAALGLVTLTPMPVRWVKNRITTITGSGATISTRLAAVP